jgi:uncharacterized protein
MKLSRLARDLYEEISELTIIDAHEHLPSEKEYLSFNYSGLNMFAGYVWHDLESAGMSSEFKETMCGPGGRPVEEWWPQIRPYWPHVKNGSYAKALLITAKEFFGIEDINDSTIHEFAGKVKAANKPGIYKKILQDKCNVRYAITCIEEAIFPDDPVLLGLNMDSFVAHPEYYGPELVSVLAEKAGLEIRGLDDLGQAIQSLVRRDFDGGAIGLKMISWDYRGPDPAAAKKELQDVLNNRVVDPKLPALRSYLMEKCLDVAAEYDKPVAVHAGYWHDFRELDPKFMLGFCRRRTDLSFDLFHLGMPMVRDAIQIAKSFQNVTLNLVWCPIISQVQTARALDEIIDLVPVNKIIAFGGDYRQCVQKVYGHLVMAREVIAAALARRIEQDDFDREYAMYLAKLWFYDNPRRIYRIEE